MLLNYLNSLIKTGICKTIEDVQEHFKGFGINSNIFEDLIQFKYDTITASWKTPLSYYCRGVILSYGSADNIEFQYVARTYDKFFNQAESLCKYNSDEDLAKLKNITLKQKCDGTCILMYYHNGKWRVSTLGSINNTATTGDAGKTFSELFWSLNVYPKDIFEKSVTYIFELCTRENQIVTQYETDRIYLLSAIDTESGVFVDTCDYPHKRPKELFLPEGVKTSKELYSIAEKYFTEGLGKNPEGVVGYSNLNAPIFKVKFTEYVTLHHTMTGDDKFVKKTLVKLLFEEKIDDLMGDLTDDQIEFVGRVKNRIIEIEKEMSTAVDELQTLLSGEKKTYAIRALELGKNVLAGYWFGGYLMDYHKNQISFREWLKTPYNKNSKLRYDVYMDYFKGL